MAIKTTLMFHSLVDSIVGRRPCITQNASPLDHVPIPYDSLSYLNVGITLSPISVKLSIAPNVLLQCPYTFIITMVFLAIIDPLPSTSPPSTPYSSTSTSASGGLLKQWFQRSSREKKHSSPVSFKSLFRESRPTKSSDQYENHGAITLDFKSLEANANSRRAWHSFSNVNRNQQLIRDNVLHHPSTTTKGSSWEVEKLPALYSTNDRAEADAYEDCNAARAILISLVGTSFDEKSISLHPYHEIELKNALNIPMAEEVLVVPTLYVRGEYVVGIDNIMQLYKKGELGSLLLEALPHGLKRDSLCTCRGGRVLVCPLCKGKGKLSRKGQEPMRCRHCSATGLLKCPNCLYS